MTERQPDEPEVRIGRYVFRRAVSPADLEQVHRLNYETFVQEIPQHHDNGSGRLIDKVHAKNVYFIAIRDGQFVGMICVNDQPPFSIAGKLADPSVLDRLPGPLLEVRLLAVPPGRRHSLIFSGLGWMVYCHAHAGGYSHLLISAFADRLGLYERLGFRPLGPPVASGHASFVPMACEIAQFPAEVHEVAGWLARIAVSDSVIDRSGEKA